MYRMNSFQRTKTPLKYSMPFARMIPIETGNEDTNMVVVLNKDGSMQTTWSYCGPDLGSTVPEELAIITQALNNVFKTVESGFVFYFEAQRHPSTAYRTDVHFPDPITMAIDEERKFFFSNGDHFESDFYCTLWWIPPSDTEDRMAEMVIEGREHKEPDVSEAIEKFRNVSEKISTIFKQQNIPSVYLDADEMLTYLHSTVSDNHRKLKFPEKPVLLDKLLYDAPLYGGLTPKLGKKHLRVVTPIKYASGTYFGFFDVLNQLNFSYRWVTRYYCLSKTDAITELEGIKKQWYGKIKPLMSMVKEILLDRESSGNENVNAAMKFDETKDAITATQNDTTSYGFFSTGIIILDENKEQAENKAKLVVTTLMNNGLQAKSESMNAVDAWMGLIPGNVGRFNRRPMISTGNLVHMMPLSNIWAGSDSCKHLQGPPLLYTQTIGNTPFRMNIHVKQVGHSMMVGQTGGGKSVHLCLLEAQFRKYENAKVIIFDKGASSIALTLAVGGTFYDLGSEAGHSVSFQPLRHVDDINEQQWLLGWFVDFLTGENFTVTPAHSKKLLTALKTVAAYKDPSARRMTNFVNAVMDESLKTALQPLTVAGAYGRIFDATNENLSFSSWQTFEMEKIMASSKEIVGPVLMYIFHRIEEKLRDNEDGGPTLIVLDECWVFFQNEQFARKIDEWLRVLRKANASVVFATQQPEDIVNSPIFTTINTNCDTKIFLPYKKAITDDVLATYRKFGLNKRQVQILNEATLARDYYYSSSQGARLYTLALEYCPLTLAFIALGKKDVQKAKELMMHPPKGPFWEAWLKYKKIEIVPEEETTQWRDV